MGADTVVIMEPRTMLPKLSTPNEQAAMWASLEQTGDSQARHPLSIMNQQGCMQLPRQASLAYTLTEDRSRDMGKGLDRLFKPPPPRPPLPPPQLWPGCGQR